jgi:hypothetical protein
MALPVIVREFLKRVAFNAAESAMGRGRRVLVVMLVAEGPNGELVHAWKNLDNATARAAFAEMLEREAHELRNATATDADLAAGAPDTKLVH